VEEAGGGWCNRGAGGGGGAGGYRTSFPGGTKLTLTGFGFLSVPVTVGAGGCSIWTIYILLEVLQFFQQLHQQEVEVVEFSMEM
jgi:hypothetical protein